jgi:hypothetical protein
MNFSSALICYCMALSLMKYEHNMVIISQIKIKLQIENQFQIQFSEIFIHWSFSTPGNHFLAVTSQVLFFQDRARWQGYMVQNRDTMDREPLGFGFSSVLFSIGLKA